MTDAPTTAPEATAGPYTADLIARFNHTTHFPTTAAKENADHRQHMAELRQGVAERLARYGQQGTPEDVERALVRYERAVIDSFHRRVRAREMAPPMTVVGPANYHKHARPEKADKHQQIGWQRVALAKTMLGRIVHRYAPSATIKASDDDAVSALERRIADLEAAQADRVRLNKAWRKAGEAGLVAAGVEPVLAAAIAARIADDYSWCKQPHPGYELQNANANIRRLKGRLEQVRRAKATPATEARTASGIAVEVDPAANRLRLRFPGKPDPDTRAKLKRHGFRWAPSEGAWQGYINGNTRALAAELAAAPDA